MVFCFRKLFSIVYNKQSKKFKFICQKYSLTTIKMLHKKLKKKYLVKFHRKMNLNTIHYNKIELFCKHKTTLLN